MTTPALRLWTGKTVHHRFAPFERRFEYDIFLIDLDIDRLEDAGRTTAAFRVERPALFSFRSTDHGRKEKGAALRPWAEDLFRSAGVDLGGGMIRLVTFPRHMFYRFAPLSLWYGFGQDGDLKGIIYEVNNTFGESHCYVAPVDSARAQHEASKAFHVSPFMDVAGQYRFTLRAPDEHLRVSIENWENGARTHLAAISAEHLAVSTGALVRLALVQPFASVGVAFGIHWQALKIWLKGAGYRRKPPPPGKPATIAEVIPKALQQKRGEPI